MKNKIPPIIDAVLNEATQKYSDSPATTNAGRVLRFFAKFITVKTIAQLFAHKFKTPS